MHVSHRLVLLLLLHLLGVRVHAGGTMHTVKRWTLGLSLNLGLTCLRKSKTLVLALALALEHVEERSVFTHGWRLILGTCTAG
jgi:hypothetical protein